MTTPGTDDAPAAADLPETPGVPATTPSHDAAVGFSGDAGQTTIGGAARAYITRVRGGEPGALPAVFGLVVLLVAFSNLTHVFLTVGNLANLPGQAGPTIIIAMGLIFVLLLGEIDLSAGTAGGVCAMTMALVVTKHGNLHGALKSGMYGAVIIVIVLGLAIAVSQRLWPAAVVVALGLIVMLTHLGGHVWIGMFLAMATGTAIGCVTGYLVARVGIPSFVVTLAFFLAWQGIIIAFAGTGGSISLGNYYPIIALAHRNIPPSGGWVIYAIFVGGYGAVTIYRALKRRSQRLSSEPLALVSLRVGGLALVGLFVVYFLNKNRQTNKVGTPIRGMPWVVPLILILLVVLTLLLTKTRFGRHLYAVGGNAEASRRAGIDVRRIRIAAFAMNSTLAGIGGIALASYIGGVPLDIGGGNTLLFAVGAAVVGGTSLFGGRGRIRDAVLGGTVITLIPNGLLLKNNLNASFQYVITGAFLLLAAAVDAFGRRKSAS
ncbi:MAG TPA: ABC transporter permease [Acidothermaceae bacterium]|jgi:D-xylose transport system permease protein